LSAKYSNKECHGASRTVNVAEVLEDTKLVVLSSSSRNGDVVESTNALRLHNAVTLVDVGWRRSVNVDTTGQRAHERRKAKSALGKRVPLSFTLSTSASVELDTRSDVIDVRAQVFWNVVSSSW